MPGRYVVLTPFNDGLAIYKKIRDRDERKRLKKIINAVKVPNMGVIVRTVAEGVSTQDLQEDLQRMMDKWDQIQINLRNNYKPSVLINESGKSESILRDFLNDDFTAINTNDKSQENEMKSYIEEVSTEYVDKVKYVNGGQPIFDKFGITKQIKGSFGRTVKLRSGATIVIEHTEACHVIDVNSGNRTRERSQEQNALKTNMEAAAEIARQLRLRDIGGIIVIDFIDMRESDHRKKLNNFLQKELRKDRARSTMLPVSKFGLIQITRQRLKPSLKIKTEENCPTCQGTGKVQPGILITDQIEHTLADLVQNGTKKLKLIVNPIVYSYITKGNLFSSKKWKWNRKYGVRLDIVEDQSYPLLSYDFIDKKSNEIIQTNNGTE